MSKVSITFVIDLPEGASVRVLQGGVPDDFRSEPLPVETFATEEDFAPTAPLPPVQMHRTAAVAQPVARTWDVGMKHQEDHKPLKVNARGLFCPTKMRDGSWCEWRAA